MTTTLASRHMPVYAITTARPVAPDPRSSASAPARLTRRGRLVLLVALVAVLFGVFAAVSAWTAGSARAGDGSAPVDGVAVTWVVQPGETRWQVAEAVAPDDDPRETIARIVALNGLPDASVRVGQALLVPA